MSGYKQFPQCHSHFYRKFKMSENFQDIIKFIQEVPLPSPGDVKVSDKPRLRRALNEDVGVVNRGSLQVFTVRVVVNSFIQQLMSNIQDDMPQQSIVIACERPHSMF